MTTGSTSIGDRATQALADEAVPYHPYRALLRAAMDRANLNQEQLANKSRISKTTISFIRNGVQDPRTITNSVHEAFASALDVPMWRLVEAAGYDLLKGTDMGAIDVRNQAADVNFPRIQSLADVASLPDKEFQYLLQILSRKQKEQLDDRQNMMNGRT